jgi:peptidoglycan/xylan/chitin deacetylase (PgdA/CDA1 family)
MRRDIITNAMSVDVEDYFQVSAFEKTVSRNKWDNISHRVAQNTTRIMDLFLENNVKATFFIEQLVTLSVIRTYGQLMN